MDPKAISEMIDGMTDGEFKHRVLALVRHELGLSGLQRFISLWGGSGDYTRDRHLWLDGLSLEDLRRDLEACQKNEARSSRETKA